MNLVQLLDPHGDLRTQHKTGHFRDVLPSQPLGIVLKKLNVTTFVTPCERGSLHVNVGHSVWTWVTTCELRSLHVNVGHSMWTWVTPCELGSVAGSSWWPVQNICLVRCSSWSPKPATLLTEFHLLPQRPTPSVPYNANTRTHCCWNSHAGFDG